MPIPSLQPWIFNPGPGQWGKRIWFSQGARVAGCIAKCKTTSYSINSAQAGTMSCLPWCFVLGTVLITEERHSVTACYTEQWASPQIAFLEALTSPCSSSCLAACAFHLFIPHDMNTPLSTTRILASLCHLSSWSIASVWIEINLPSRILLISFGLQP